MVSQTQLRQVQNIAGRESLRVKQREIARQVQPTQRELTNEEQIIKELYSLGSQSPVKDPYGGTVVSYSEEVLGVANALNIPAGTAHNLIQSGQIRTSGENIIYRGVNVGSASQAQAEASRILIARSQTSTPSSSELAQANVYLQEKGYEPAFNPSTGGYSTTGLQKSQVYYEVETPKGKMSFATLEQAQKYTSQENILTKPISRVELPTSEFEAIKQIYKRNIEQSQVDTGFFGVIQRVKGALSGTGEVLGNYAAQAVEKTGRLANVLGISEYKYAGGAEIESARIAGKTVGEYAPYAVPYVGEALLIAGGTESLLSTGGKQTREYIKTIVQQKNIPLISSNIGSEIVSYAPTVIEIGAGLLGLKTRVMPKKEIIVPPRKTDVTMSVTFDEAMTIKNIPRAKVTTMQEKVVGVSSTRGGTQTTFKPINPKEGTVIEGKNWLQYAGKDEGVIFTKQEGIEYNIVYKNKPTGEMEYNVFKRTNGKLEKVSSGVSSSDKKVIGLLEPRRVGYEKIQETKLGLNKYKTRTSSERKLEQQEIISLDKGYKIEDDLGFFTAKTRKRVTEVSPAEQNILFRKKYFEGDLIGARIPQKRLAPKFAKSQPPDVEQIKNILVKPSKSVSVGSIEDKTPRFEDVIQIKQESYGEFTLIRQSKLERAIKESQLLKSKKSQLTFGAVEVEGQGLEILKDIENVRIPRVYSPRKSIQKIDLVTLSEINILSGTQKVNVGTTSLLGLKSRTELKVSPKIELAQISIIETKQKQNLDLTQIQKVIQTQIQEQKIIQKVETKTDLTDTTTFERPSRDFKLKEPKTPRKIRIDIDIDLPTPSKTKTRVKELGGKLFEAIKVSKGKEISLGTERTSYLASQKLKKSLKQSLSASGYIQEGKRRLKFSEVAPAFGGEFTQGKFDITRIVQKRGTRLGTSQETFKIQKAKKIKQGGWL